MELTHKYRPKRFSDIVGQKEAVSTLLNLTKKNKIPQAIMLSGPSGCGKTTAGRILMRKVGCIGSNLKEINAADFRGIDTIREIRSVLKLIPIMGGKAKGWIIDEAAALGKPAQEAFLKILEEPGDHIYFVLATTDPDKMLKTVRTRCTDIRFNSVSQEDLEILINKICTLEKREISDKVINRIAEYADGSPRKALVDLHKVLDLKNEQEQLNSIQSVNIEKKAIDLCRLLLKPNIRWPEVANLIKNIDEEPESIRRAVLGYSASVALNGGMPGKMIHIINCFSSNYFDSGKAGLTWSCYHCVQQPRKAR